VPDLRIGIDVGGTFTDAVAVDRSGRLVGSRKEPSTPPEVERGAVTALRALAAGDGLERVVHGTTVATNALIEGRTGRIGLLTTRGFRDVLAIGSMRRPDLYDPMQVKPVPLAPRHLRLEVPERVAADGTPLHPLDEAAVERAARRFARERVDAVAVCFLFSYANPEHERRAGRILRRELPGVDVVLSADVAPMIREFPRTSTTVVNAALRPVVSSSLRELRSRAGAPVLVMQSDGGVLPAGIAAAAAHRLLVSGPAGGVVGASVFARARGIRDLVTMDMGGTSFDTCLVTGGRPSVRGESTVAGWPVLASSVDLVTVGAGGGSIARVDAGGALRVGPESAGAVPGPACYGRGGRLPTVTDANLVIGRLDPERFLGGRLALDVDAARRAIADGVARPLGVSIERAAAAVVEVASATMARALRVVSVGRGRDPAGMPLVAFGGAGPLHAVRLAEEIGAPTILIPPLPGFLSAAGLLATDLRVEEAETVLRPGRGAATPSALRRAAERLARRALRRLGEPRHRSTISLALDCRYEGQGYELTVPMPTISVEGLTAARRTFHLVHDSVYGHAAPEEPVEVVALRVIASAPGAGYRPGRAPARGRSEPAEARRLWVDGRTIEVPVHDRAALPGGWRARGPVLVREDESTAWVPSGWTVSVDALGSLEVARGRR
jgi:N-methylhydantoinase A